MSCLSHILLIRRLSLNRLFFKESNPLIRSSNGKGHLEQSSSFLDGITINLLRLVFEVMEWNKLAQIRIH